MFISDKGGGDQGLFEVTAEPTSWEIICRQRSIGCLIRLRCAPEEQVFLTAVQAGSILIISIHRHSCCHMILPPSSRWQSTFQKCTHDGQEGTILQFLQMAVFLIFSMVQHFRSTILDFFFWEFWKTEQRWIRMYPWSTDTFTNRSNVTCWWFCQSLTGNPKKRSLDGFSFTGSWHFFVRSGRLPLLI